MKKMLSLVVLAFILPSFIWCCNAEGAELNTELNIQYSGEYRDIENEYNTLSIEKSEDEYTVLFSIHRLIQLEFAASKSDGKLQGVEHFDYETSIGVEFEWNDDVLTATITQSAWDLLPTGTEFHFVPKQTDEYHESVNLTIVEQGGEHNEE